MFTCQCLNVSIAVNEESTAATDPGPVTLKLETSLPRPPADVIARLAEGKSRELASFFQESVGPLQDASVTMQLIMMLKTIPCEGWNVNKCLNCGCVAFARNSSNPSVILINGTLAVTAEEINRRKAQENYSPAYRIVLDGRAANFRGFYRKDQYRSLFTAAANTLDSTNDRNELLESLRAFMRAETQAANERIARFTQELNEQLSNVRDRAEQDYLFLAQTFVPELVDSNKSGEQGATATATSPSTMTEKALQPLLTSLGTTPVAADVAGSQLETPPPTPECMPMSTGNSPPSIVNGNNGTSSVSPEQPSSAMDGFKPAKLSNSAANTINNNTTNSNQGAISKPPTQQQHSMSTNLFANHGNTLGAATTVPGLAGSVGNLAGATHRFSSTIQQRPQQQQHQTMFDSDCLFDIDGMENDKTPPPDDITDEEQSDYDDLPDNNNRSEGGIVIPRHQYGRQTSSIAKSLPISMPKKMAPFRANEDDLDEMAEDTVDIAASIKALAKSVHGEAVFGDLPRRQIQKFTSQI
ncbi:uncharacterized protein LOC126568118 [Anopheles maculipalpis]|uniref:uncharacterized protein LOC126568118 n=1 Tax=Anopheles maculipalpis TaxID=1496333 RepID=UPI00215938F0|nr:uncharacterized protein LOC126568118 [Anopheles maculipalpis]